MAKHRTSSIAAIIFMYFCISTLCLIGPILFSFIVGMSNDGSFNSRPYGNMRKLLADSSTADITLIKNHTNVFSNCTPAAIEQFPHPLMDYKTRVNGGVLIHILVCLYMFLALAIVCDEYFVPSLEIMCEALKIDSDVAGATLMAAGSSAPELATAVIAVFVAKDDIGVGTVVGSAVYNIAFVISVCGLFAGRTVLLNWWPMYRDSFFYLVSILVLLLSMHDETITWLESLLFLIVYAAYIAFMFVNRRVEKWVSKMSCLRSYCPAGSEHSNLYGYNTVSTDPSALDLQEKGSTQIQATASSPHSQLKEGSECEIFKRPDGFFRNCLWLIKVPLLCMCYFTVPDCRKKKWRGYFIMTFILSCLWISVLSYIMVWMITIIGFTLHIPDTVMALTFLAAGVSVPDAIASLIVVREGLGDMAVSNAIGSNVFDILLCLGLPWFLQTAIFDPGSKITVISKGLVYSTVTLLSTVIFLLVSTHLNGWKLNKKHGVILMIWYLVFMAFSTLYELNIFGPFNPPACPSNF